MISCAFERRRQNFCCNSYGQLLLQIFCPSEHAAKRTVRLSLPDFIRAFFFPCLFPKQYVTRFRIAQTYFLQVFIVTKIDMAMEIGYS